MNDSFRLRWRDALSAYGPPKTLYNQWKRWGAAGVFTRMMEGLAAAGSKGPENFNSGRMKKQGGRHGDRCD